MLAPRFISVLCGTVLISTFAALDAAAQCAEEPRLDNFRGAGRTTCPCFVENEQAGAVFSPPPEHFPIEILRVGIGWGSQVGGTQPSVEDSINIYEGGLPSPGESIFSLSGPQLTDGVINEFDLEPFAGEILVNEPPFTVTLWFLNSNANNPFAASVVHDGLGCQPGKNVVYAIPGGWTDGCALGITGNWVFYVVYRQVNCGGSGGNGSVPDGDIVPGAPMTCTRVAGGDIEFSWSASCSSTDDDYEIYEGSLDSFYSHAAKLCTTGGTTTATVSPASGDRYYLVVPRDATTEGSYGRNSAGDERQAGSPKCVDSGTVSCP
jgi:hypothetical protein